jgi:glycosyltransferase involved in cell wall biosynthesis
VARVASIAFTHYDSDPRVRRMATALADRGDEVVAVVLRNEGQSRVRSVDGVEVVGIRIRQYRGGNALVYLGQYLAFFFAAMFVLTRLHLRRRFDLVHANNMPDFIVFAALPLKLSGTPVVLDIHDPMPELFESKFGSSAQILVRLVAWVEDLSVRFADRVISVHDIQLQTLLSRGYPPERFIIVQNVADERHFPRAVALDTAVDPNPITVVYHGLIAPRLGLDIAVRAMARVRAEADGVRLMLIGDGDGASEIKRLTDELDLGEVVDFQQGFIPIEELLPKLSKAQIGIVPARVDPFTKNMLPTKLVEYVTLGIPVICTELPAVCHYFGDDQIVMIPQEDPDALAAAIIELVRDPERRHRLATRALGFVDEHGWERQREKYRSLVDSLVGNG